MKPGLKAPGTMPLKLRYDGPLSNLALVFNLCRCTMAEIVGNRDESDDNDDDRDDADRDGDGGVIVARSPPVRRCRFTL